MGPLILVLASVALTAASPAPGRDPPPSVREPRLTAAELGLIVNLEDPLSVAIGDYYRRVRAIPAGNVLDVHLRRDITVSPSEFIPLYADLRRRTPAAVQAYALTWAAPYRVGCMSITSAFAFGFDTRFCSSRCTRTQPNPWFDGPGHHPMTDRGLRPTMSIAATRFADAKALIDRGLASDGTAPSGTAYLLSTGDARRNVRAARYALVEHLLGARLAIRRVEASSLRDAPDVMFYFVGASSVGDLGTNRFLPGAVGDHLTSTGGALTHTAQMSSLRWLEAGATGSYGTVTEPCNFPGKFPDPAVLIFHYLAGDTLLEAYWKSVLMPGQGIFIGEPLARPYGPTLP